FGPTGITRCTKRENKESNKLSTQVKNHAKLRVKPSLEYDGGVTAISTGSTLLDLAISGGRFRHGGIPSGILVEIFGPSGSGKSVLLSEIAGQVQKQGGKIMFKDPEARLNKQFAKLFNLDVDTIEYENPNTVPEVFKPVRAWDPKPEGKVHGIFTDSLAALSTEMELDEKDQYGMRRASEFSKELRKTCRVITSKNFLMVCSNQVRTIIGAGPYEQKQNSPGGLGIGFYSSLRLRCGSPTKIKRTRTIGGKELKRVIGVDVLIDVYKSSIWVPYLSAPVSIIFDYGIDDIRQNLKFVRQIRKHNGYILGDSKLGKSLDEAISVIEAGRILQQKLKIETIALWREVEAQFIKERKPKY
ncbi:DNA recombination/repair protein RecA, partial [Patescibacteria group bacterium]|nr:DNA recombination/repair protein RecA [Patescibacteria group bacterium]